MDKAGKKNLIPKSQDLSAWYNRVVLQAELADYGPVRGTMVYRPYGYAIWEQIQKHLDEEIKKSGAVNAYFPMFIPESLIKKEKEHIEGFAPELAVVTIGGGEKLSERLIVRPTSEMVMYQLYAKWIQSWRDLPLIINQWNNVVRWEKRTYLFLRTLEFLWQEGHGAHATHKESWERVLWGINTYAKTYQNLLAIPGFIGKKSESEKFAGGVATLAYESLIPDGKALQGCTSHDLGQNFSKALNIQFQDKKGETKYVWQNSWGFTTRSIGALVLIHGDDDGLILPPKLAPIQIIIIPIENHPSTQKYLNQLASQLQQYRIKIDDSDVTPGWKFNQWELKGVPLRLEIGKKEVKGKSVTIANRLTRQKQTISLDQLSAFLNRELDTFQNELFARANQFLKSHTSTAATYAEFKTILKENRGFIWAFWCENPNCEAKIKAETKATTRLLPLGASDAPLDASKEKGSPAESAGKCIYCKKPASHRWLFAQSY